VNTSILDQTASEFSTPRRKQPSPKKIQVVPELKLHLMPTSISTPSPKPFQLRSNEQLRRLPPFSSSKKRPSRFQKNDKITFEKQMDELTDTPLKKHK
jgi:hypothetical protein